MGGGEEGRVTWFFVSMTFRFLINPELSLLANCCGIRGITETAAVPLSRGLRMHRRVLFWTPNREIGQGLTDLAACALFRTRCQFFLSFCSVTKTYDAHDHDHQHHRHRHHHHHYTGVFSVYGEYPTWPPSATWPTKRAEDDLCMCVKEEKCLQRLL